MHASVLWLLSTPSHVPGELDEGGHSPPPPSPPKHISLMGSVSLYPPSPFPCPSPFPLFPSSPYPSPGGLNEGGHARADEAALLGIFNHAAPDTVLRRYGQCGSVEASTSSEGKSTNSHSPRPAG